MASKLLIVAGEAASSAEDVPFGVRELLDAADEILVVTPALPNRLEWLTSATDRSREEADERLQTVLGHVSDSDTEVRGAVGSDDPVDALNDAIREFAPDHLLIALRPAERDGWQERGLLDRIRDDFALPFTVFAPSERASKTRKPD